MIKGAVDLDLLIPKLSSVIPLLSSMSLKSYYYEVIIYMAIAEREINSDSLFLCPSLFLSLN